MVEPIVKRAGGLDVHKKSVVASVVLEQEDGTLSQETRTFGTTGEQRRALCAWLMQHRIELVVMESTGIYWKSVYAALEEAGLKTYVVNARQVKQVPGRKTDVSDSQWLASLARFGLLKASFIPPKDLRELRLITRYRLKLQGMLASEKNRLHKVLDEAGGIGDLECSFAQGLCRGPSGARYRKNDRNRLTDRDHELCLDHR